VPTLQLIAFYDILLKVNYVNIKLYILYSWYCTYVIRNMMFARPELLPHILVRLGHNITVIFFNEKTPNLNFCNQLRIT